MTGGRRERRQSEVNLEVDNGEIIGVARGSTIGPVICT